MLEAKRVDVIAGFAVELVAEVLEARGEIAAAGKMLAVSGQQQATAFHDAEHWMNAVVRVSKAKGVALDEEGAAMAGAVACALMLARAVGGEAVEWSELEAHASEQLE